MRLCDRDIEAWLDEGRLSINPRPPVERINGATVDVRLGNKFRTFRGHTAAFIDLSGPKDEVSAALDRVMSDEIVLDEGEAFYHLIEVMTCQGGCVGGAGQPRGLKATKEKRGDGLHQSDNAAMFKRAERNPIVVRMMAEYGEERCHELLHVSYEK